MTDSTDELAGLPEDVREAIEMVESMERDLHDGRAPSSTLRTDFMRLAHGHKTALAAWRDAEAELAALKAKMAQRQRRESAWLDPDEPV